MKIIDTNSRSMKGCRIFEVFNIPKLLFMRRQEKNTWIGKCKQYASWLACLIHIRKDGWGKLEGLCPPWPCY